MKRDLYIGVWNLMLSNLGEGLKAWKYILMIWLIVRDLGIRNHLCIFLTKKELNIHMRIASDLQDFTTVNKYQELMTLRVL
jgi:hypothetical protein